MSSRPLKKGQEESAESLTLYGKVVTRLYEKSEPIANQVKEIASPYVEKIRAKQKELGVMLQSSQITDVTMKLNTVRTFAALQGGKYINYVQSLPWNSLVSPQISNKLEGLMEVASERAARFRDLFVAAWGKIRWKEYADNVSKSAGDLKPYLESKNLYEMPTEMMKAAAHSFHIATGDENTAAYSNALKDLMASIFDVYGLLGGQDGKKDG